MACTAEQPLFVLVLVLVRESYRWRSRKSRSEVQEEAGSPLILIDAIESNGYKSLELLINSAIKVKVPEFIPRIAGS
jgi:hypothetical protein